MALQGTIDAFPIPDVLRLLGSSQKSGELVVTGTASTCAVWIGDGTIFGGTTSRSSVIPPVLAVFETLRIDNGSFEFTSLDTQDLPDSGFDPVPTETAITEAEELSRQWIKIQEIVPSLEHELKLAPKLPSDRIAVDQDTWELITNIGAATSVGDLAVVLDIGEFEVCARTAALVESGLMLISEPTIRSVKKDAVDLGAVSKRTEKAEEESTVDTVDPAGANGLGKNAGAGDDIASEDDTDAEFPEKFPIDDLVNEDESETSSHWDSFSTTPVDEPVSSFDALSAFGNDDYLEFEQVETEEAFAPEIEVMPLGDFESAPTASNGVHAQTSDSTDEVLRQMSKLSPQAAEAIAAAMRPGLGGLESRNDDLVRDDEITFLDTL